MGVSLFGIYKILYQIYDSPLWNFTLLVTVNKFFKKMITGNKSLYQDTETYRKLHNDEFYTRLLVSVRLLKIDDETLFYSRL